EQPRTQKTVIDQGKLFAGDAFAIERVRAKAAPAKGIIDDANAIGKELRAHLVAKKAGLARNRGAVHGTRQMRDQRASRTWIQDDGHFARRNLAWVEARDRALASLATDVFRPPQIRGVTHGRIVVVAFHAGAVDGDGRHRQAVIRSDVRAAETVAGDQHHSADTGGRRG